MGQSGSNPVKVSQTGLPSPGETEAEDENDRDASGCVGGVVEVFLKIGLGGGAASGPVVPALFPDDASEVGLGAGPDGIELFQSFGGVIFLPPLEMGFGEAQLVDR